MGLGEGVCVAEERACVRAFPSGSQHGFTPLLRQFIVLSFHLVAPDSLLRTGLRFFNTKLHKPIKKAILYGFFDGFSWLDFLCKIVYDIKLRRMVRGVILG